MYNVPTIQRLPTQYEREEHARSKLTGREWLYLFAAANVILFVLMFLGSGD